MNDDRLRAAAARFTADDRPFPPTPSEAILLQLRTDVPPLPRGQHRGRGRARAGRLRRIARNPLARFIGVIALTTVLSVIVIGGCVWGAQTLLDRSEPLQRPSRIVPMPTPAPDGAPR